MTPRPASGSPSDGSRTISTCQRRPADAARRATRLLGATKPASGRLTVVLDPFVTAQFLASSASTLSGEAVLKGRSLFADRLGEEVGAPVDHAGRRSHRPRAYTASDTDGEGLASRRNVLIDEGVLRQFVHNGYTGAALGHRLHRERRPGLQVDAGRRLRACRWSPGTKEQPELLADVGDGVLVSAVSGLHSGVNPVSGDFSTGAEGLRIARRVISEPLREFTIASTLQTMLQDVVAVGVRPRVASHERSRRQPGHPRRHRLRRLSDAGGPSDRARRRAGPDRIPADLEQRTPAHRAGAVRLGGPRRAVHGGHPARDDGSGAPLLLEGPLADHGCLVPVLGQQGAPLRQGRQDGLVPGRRHDPDRSCSGSPSRTRSRAALATCDSSPRC